MAATNVAQFMKTDNHSLSVFRFQAFSEKLIVVYTHFSVFIIVLKKPDLW